MSPKQSLRIAFISSAAIFAAPFALSLRAATPQAPRSAITVDANGAADYKSVQQAVDALPATGGVIRIRPGVYREKIHVDKPHVSLIGLGRDPSDVILTFDLSHHDVKTTFGSASTTVTGDDFLAENLTFQNTFSDEHPEVTVDAQAVALRVIGDRDVFRHVHILAYQDSLYADSKKCHAAPSPSNSAGATPAPATTSGSQFVLPTTPCTAARQLFTDSVIAGTVDFIFGDANAAFVRCEIRSRPHQEGTLTAQSKYYPAESSAYVFDHCRLTADPGVTNVFLGRPWRPYSTVVFLNTEMGAQIQPAGWLEWPRNGAPSLTTSFYAEFHSTGPGAPIAAAKDAAATGPNGTQRNPYAKILTPGQAAKFAVRRLLRGADNWNPQL